MDLDQNSAASNDLPDRCSPDFFVVTPPRSGSTWLFENLRRHPEIFIPANKEMKYFSNYRNMCGLDWYLNCFKEGAQKKKGDVSPSYAILPDDALGEASKLFPHLRIIFTFRDPVERAWSHLKHQFNLKESVFHLYSGPFETIPNSKITECLTSPLTVAYSDYLSIVQRWVSFFPKENIYLNFLDFTHCQEKRLLLEIFQHIGVSQKTDWSLFPIDRKINIGLDHEMPDEIRNFLISFYGGRTKEFAEFIQDTFNIKIPESWAYILRGTPDWKTGNPYKKFFESNNQVLLHDILLSESVYSTHVQTLKDDYNGFRIIAYQGMCLAISHALNSFDITQARNVELEKLKRNKDILCSDSLDNLMRLIDETLLQRREAQLEDLQSQTAKWEQKLDALQEELSAITSQIGDCQNQMTKMLANFERLHEDLTSRDAALEALRQQRDEQNIRLQQLQLELSGRGQQVDELERRLSELNHDNLMLDQERTMLGERIRDLEQSIAQKDSTCQQLNEDLSSKNNQIDCLQEQLNEIKALYDNLEKDRTTQHSRIKELENLVSQKDANLEQSNKELADREGTIASLQEQLNEIKALHDNLEKDRTTQHSRIQELESKIVGKDAFLKQLEKERETLLKKLNQIQSTFLFRLQSYLKKI